MGGSLPRSSLVWLKTSDVSCQYASPQLNTAGTNNIVRHVAEMWRVDVSVVLNVYFFR